MNNSPEVSEIVPETVLEKMTVLPPPSALLSRIA